MADTPAASKGWRCDICGEIVLLGISPMLIFNRYVSLKGGGKQSRVPSFWSVATKPSTPLRRGNNSFSHFLVCRDETCYTAAEGEKILSHPSGTQQRRAIRRYVTPPKNSGPPQRSAVRRLHHSVGPSLQRSGTHFEHL